MLFRSQSCGNDPFALVIPWDRLYENKTSALGCLHSRVIAPAASLSGWLAFQASYKFYLQGERQPLRAPPNSTYTGVLQNEVERGVTALWRLYYRLRANIMRKVARGVDLLPHVGVEQVLNDLLFRDGSGLCRGGDEKAQQRASSGQAVGSRGSKRRALASLSPRARWVEKCQQCCGK